jgi:hypothetical protein
VQFSQFRMLGAVTILGILALGPRVSSTQESAQAGSASNSAARNAKAEEVCLLASTAYEESIPCQPPPPRTNWVSVQWQEHQKSARCEVEHTDVTYVPAQHPNEVIPTNRNSPGPLIHGLRLASGPIECGVLAPGERAIIDFPRDPQLPNLLARSSIYVFRDHKIYISIELRGEFIDVLYHQDAATQRLSRFRSGDMHPENVTFTLLADLDGDGKADAWLTFGFGGDATQDMLLMSGTAAPDELVRVVKRTKPAAH